MTQDKNLSKDEAIKAMQEGKKVTHTLFPDGEYIYFREGKVYGEDDELIERFFEDRDEDHWEDGWRIFTTIDELKEENTKLLEQNTRLKEALRPLAELDLEGVNTSMDGNVVYQRNKTYLNVGDIYKAKEALNIK